MNHQEIFNLETNHNELLKTKFTIFMHDNSKQYVMRQFIFMSIKTLPKGRIHSKKKKVVNFHNWIHIHPALRQHYFSLVPCWLSPVPPKLQTKPNIQ